MATAKHGEWNEDGVWQPHPGYKVDVCVLCVASKVRGAVPLEDVAFVHGGEDASDTCGLHREPTSGDRYTDQAPHVDEPKDYGGDMQYYDS